MEVFFAVLSVVFFDEVFENALSVVLFAVVFFEEVLEVVLPALSLTEPFFEAVLQLEEEPFGSPGVHVVSGEAFTSITVGYNCSLIIGAESLNTSASEVI